MPELGAVKHRVFFALWPDEESVARLAALGQGLAPPGSRLMKPASLHLTLAFIGAVDAERLESLRVVAASVSADAFELALDKIGLWHQRGVLWAGCHQAPAGLRRLQQALMPALVEAGFAVARKGEEPVPHVTLARHVRRIDTAPPFDPIRWRVGEFALVESHLHPSSASYRTLATFPLSER